MFKSIDPKKAPAEREKGVIKFWKENQIFEKTIENRREAKSYSFFDGPPFITGVPHFGTILSSVAKDVVPRYFTMKGFRVDRRWGWDCHGLPAENLVEKKLGSKSKRDIEEKIGIEKFVNECFIATSKIAGEWEEIIDRIGRFVDFKNSYKTMDSSYMESVWWAFKELYNKGLVYKDSRISLYCPRCATPLSNFEIAMDNSYQDVTDEAVFVKFNLHHTAKTSLGIPLELEAYFVAWTTTPWTLPANTALAVNPNNEYSVVASKNKKGEEYYFILGSEKFKQLKKEKDWKGKAIKKVKGEELLGLHYEKLNLEEEAKTLTEEEAAQGWRIVSGEFVTEAEGSGIVHLAPAFGEDDYRTAKAENLPIVLNVNEEGKFCAGKYQDKNVWEANPEILKDLKEKGLVLDSEKVEHSYPFCHRCSTKLIYKVQPAWFINVASIKDKLIAANEDIEWHPEHLKHGRFLKNLESAPDWNISRNRYWGTAIPVWECDQCGKREVVGSFEELFKFSGQRLDNYHRPFIDNITFKCSECEGVARRVPEVLDCWVESGSMPFAERHYPFENQEDFNQKFPADFISEYVGQTRAWFYVIHVLSVALFGRSAYKNVVTTGVIAGTDGRKMSKSLGNYPDPKIVLDKYSADALRFYLMSSPIMEAENVNFSEEKVAEIQKGFLRAWWNSYFFFVTYAKIDDWKPEKEKPFQWSDPQSFKEAWAGKPVSILDAWIFSELHILIKQMNELMDGYEIAKAARLLPEFIDKLSNWYIRRSRKRFWKTENDEDKSEAYQTLYEVLTKFNQLAAPFMPFMTEEIFQNLNRSEEDKVEVGESEEQTHEFLKQVSVHLTDFPQPNLMLINEKLNSDMDKIRQIVTLGLSCRAKRGIKVRQPLKTLFVQGKNEIEESLWDLVKDELNVKDVKEKENLKELIEGGKLTEKSEGMVDKDNNAVALDVAITAELKLEGEMRELVRQIQEARKKAGFEIEDRIVVGYKGKNEVFDKFEKQIAAEVLANEIKSGSLSSANHSFEAKLDGGKIKIELKKV